MDENEIAEILQQTNQIEREEIEGELDDPSEGEQEDPSEEEDEDNVVDENEDDEDEVIIFDDPDEQLFRDYEAEDDEQDELQEYEDSEQEDIELDADPEIDENPGVRRTERVRYPPTRYGFHNIKTPEQRTEEYDVETAAIIAKVMLHIQLSTAGMTTDEAYSFIQTYSIDRGIKEFGERGWSAGVKEMSQLHNREVFAPIHVHELTEEEKKKALESLMFLTEKRDKSIKARTCANGSTQREYIDREEAASPTASTEAILITGVVDAKEERDVMSLDVPNAFVQTKMPKAKERVIMKIRGRLVDILLHIAPEIYEKYVIYNGKHKLLYVEMLKALYGMIVSSLLYYKKFRKDIEAIGFKINPYDPCVANRQVNGSQHTITWHVDDLKSSHKDPKVNDKFHKWCESMYGSDDLGHVKVVRGKKHDYLAMILDYTKKGSLKVDMKYYIDGMIKDFPHQIPKVKMQPWTENLFKVNDNANKIDKTKREVFHTFVMKAMFLCKRARPDIMPAICFLSSRVSEPNVDDWNKLLRVLGYLRATRDDVLELSADDTNTITWYVDAAFAVHKDMKSHTGAVFTLGKGSIMSESTKQKNNSRSSTEAELNAVDEKLSKILWVRKFLEAQGYNVKENVVYQDNTSTIKLQKNAKASSGKRTRHFDIKLFYITDLINRNEVSVEYCPTGQMLADYMTKPLVGSKFRSFRSEIMNL